MRAPTLTTACVSLPPEGAGLAWGGPARRTRIAVIDFETTGISPGQGARATEVAIVLLEGGVVVDRFQSLMKTGAWIPPFITQLTGITNAMVNARPTQPR
jgi:DNA polymerase III epsilon subunit-like protein